MTEIGGLSLQAYAGGVAKADWTNEFRSTKDRQGNLMPSGNSMGEGGLSQAAITNVVQSFLVTVENESCQEN